MQISLHVVVVNLSQTLALLNDSSHSDLSDIIEEEEGSDCDQVIYVVTKKFFFFYFYLNIEWLQFFFL